MSYSGNVMLCGKFCCYVGPYPSIQLQAQAKSCFVEYLSVNFYFTCTRCLFYLNVIMSISIS